MQIRVASESAANTARAGRETSQSRFYWAKMEFRKWCDGLMLCGMVVAKSKHS
jgi:hypothetical protein